MSKLHNNILINLSILFNQPTGIATYAANILPELKSLNPTLLTANQYADFNSYQISDDMSPAAGTKGHLKRLFWTQFKLPKIYKQLQANLIFAPIPEAPLYSKTRFIVMCHDLIPLRFPRFSPLLPYFRAYIPQVLQQAKHIICNSQATAKDITDFYGINSNKITPILLAYDAKNFRPIITNIESKTKPYFLYLGRHDSYKNLTRLIQAFAQLPNNTDYELKIAGTPDPRYTPSLQQLAQELAITQQVKFLNYVSYQELPRLISNAIALVFPTLWEGFGLPVLEAMACGTPVITSNLASLPEIVGNAGILIDPYNIAEIASAMQEIAQNTQLQSYYRTLGLQRAKKFSWQKTGKATKKVIEKYI